MSHSIRFLGLFVKSAGPVPQVRTDILSASNVTRCGVSFTQRRGDVQKIGKASWNRVDVWI